MLPSPAGGCDSKSVNQPASGWRKELGRFVSPTWYALELSLLAVGVRRESDLPSQSSDLDPHWHDYVRVLTPVGPDRLHDGLAHLILEFQCHTVGLSNVQKIEHILRIEADFD